MTDEKKHKIFKTMPVLKDGLKKQQLYNNNIPVSMWCTILYLQERFFITFETSIDLWSLNL